MADPIFLIDYNDKNKAYLESLIPKISEYLKTNLKLSLYPKKVFIKTISSGVDFLGWVHFPHHRVLRTTTRRRMIRRLKHNPTHEAIMPYKGLLSHGNAYKLAKRYLRKIV